MCCGEWKGWPPKPANNSSWIAVVTPTYRPKSIRNRCVIERFGVFVLSFYLFLISVAKGVACCHWTKSYIFLFLLIYKNVLTTENGLI